MTKTSLALLASTAPPAFSAVIALGSNIDPEKHIKAAKEEIAKIAAVTASSSFIYTKPLLYEQQPPFLNGALLISSFDPFEVLKQKLKQIEERLGRVRSANRNGPRTIDLDIICFAGKVTDDDYYKRDFLRQFVRELGVCIEPKQ